MTDTVTAKLAEWEALAEGATKGPWTFEPAGESHCAEPQCCSEYWDNRIWGNGVVLAESHMLSDEDAAFIAAARTIAPALLGFVRDALTLIDEDHCPGGCEHDAIDAEVLGDRIKRALMEQIGDHL